MKFLLKSCYFSLFFLLAVSCGNRKNIGFHSKLNTLEGLDGRKIKIDSLEKFMAKEMDSLKIPAISIAIINDHEIIFAENIGVKNLVTKEKVNKYNIFEACSLSKPVFAYFVMTLAEKGIIDIDKPLYQYYKENDIEPGKNYESLTARMILCHASGFPNWREPSEEKLLFLFPPGTRYGYSGEGYQYLARVLMHILKTDDKGLNALFQKEVARPLGMHSMNFIWKKSLSRLKVYSHAKGLPTDNGPQGPADWFGSAGSLHTNAYDYARFMLKLMDNSKLSQECLAVQTAMPAAENGLHRSLTFPYVFNNGSMKYFHTGNNGDTRAYCEFDAEKKWGVVLFSNCDHFFASQCAAHLLRYLGSDIKF